MNSACSFFTNKIVKFKKKKKDGKYMCLRVTIAVKKHHDQKHLGEKRVYFIKVP